MKKIFIAIAVVSDVVCWNWLLESRSLAAMIGFFAFFIVSIYLLPNEDKKVEKVKVRSGK